VSGPSVGNNQLHWRNKSDNDVLKKKPTGTDGDSDEGAAGGVATTKEPKEGVVSEGSCGSAVSNIDVGKSSRITKSGGRFKDQYEQMIMEDLPTVEASASGVRDGEAGGVESRAIGDTRRKNSAIDTSLDAPGDGESVD